MLGTLKNICKTAIIPGLIAVVVWISCYVVVDVLQKYCYRVADAATISQNLLRLHRTGHWEKALTEIRTFYENHSVFLMRGITVADSQGRFVMQYPQSIETDGCTVSNGVDACLTDQRFRAWDSWPFAAYLVDTRVADRLWGPGDVIPTSTNEILYNVNLYFDTPLTSATGMTHVAAIIISLALITLYFRYLHWREYRRRIEQLERDKEEMERQRETERQHTALNERESRLTALRAVMHDIKNYAQKVDSPASFIRKKIQKVPDLEPSVTEFINRQCTVLDETAQQMRDNIEASRPLLEASNADLNYVNVRDETFEPQAILQRLDRMYAPLCKELGISLRLYLPSSGTPVQARGDSRLLLNSLDNLIKNSLDAFQKANGGAKNPEIALSLAQAEGHVQVHASDNGPGLPSGLARDFRLGRMIQSQSGWGVGLKYIRDHMRLMGASVGYSENKPSGCIFTFELEEVRDE